ncbi:TetR/AcrR family transcriptional regulator [Streptomyces sp. 21So2-11]|uniref:TetR/AcrR family transcriptional regulator n=1 Tax=Streptomyces sp. 21So2-11 TaxID=3144408 RepID=UPI0032199B7D
MAGSKDPRTARTRGRLREALLAACEEQTLEQVAVSDVVRRAGVGRATFYLHYDDLHTLAVDACAGLVRDAVDALHAWETPPGPEHPPGALVDLLDAVRARVAVHRSLLRPGGGGPLGELLHEELRLRSLAERRQRRPGGGDGDEAVASAVAGLFTGVLADWVHGRVTGTPPELAGRVWRMLVALHATHGRA